MSNPGLLDGELADSVLAASCVNSSADRYATTAVRRSWQGVRRDWIHFLSNAASGGLVTLRPGGAEAMSPLEVPDDVGGEPSSRAYYLKALIAGPPANVFGRARRSHPAVVAEAVDFIVEAAMNSRYARSASAPAQAATHIQQVHGVSQVEYEAAAQDHPDAFPWELGQILDSDATALIADLRLQQPTQGWLARTWHVQA